MSPSRITGVERAIGMLHRKTKQVKEVTTSALVRVGLLIQRDAMLLVPVDTGALRLSAFTVWRDGQNGDGVMNEAHATSAKQQQAIQKQQETALAFMSGTIRDAQVAIDPTVFVGFGSAYAIFVHENDKAFHPVGQARYLELAVLNHVDSIERIIKDEAAGVI